VCSHSPPCMGPYIFLTILMSNILSTLISSLVFPFSVKINEPQLSNEDCRLWNPFLILNNFLSHTSDTLHCLHFVIVGAHLIVSLMSCRSHPPCSREHKPSRGIFAARSADCGAPRSQGGRGSNPTSPRAGIVGPR